MGTELQQRGVRVTLLAARYAGSWPETLSVREMEVVRPLAAPRGDWSSGLYTRGLQKWLREHAETYDVLYADWLREEAAAVVHAAGRCGRPAIVRCGGIGDGSDAVWARHSRAARRTYQDALGADCVVAPDAVSAREAIAAGAERQRVQRINDGFPNLLRRDARTRSSARASLAAINHDLLVDPDSRVALFCGRFESDSGMCEAAEGLAPLCLSEFKLRLWFVGDGPGRESLHRTLCDLGIRHLCAMPGWFGHVDELYHAADLFIASSPHDGLEHRLPTAIMAGLPCVVRQSSEAQSRMQAVQTGLYWYPIDTPNQLASTVAQVLHDESATQKAESLRNQALESESRTAMVDEFLRCIRKVIRDTPGSTSTSRQTST